ncbi:mitogen-activated protein kinase kinase kinase 17-like [Triticum urartu]|nr:mitogen-activated protein kinase kinase kinase 17-like [Triticum urartu]
MAMSKQWTRVRTLGRGASGAEVFLAADDPSGELFAVKSASAACAAALRREQCIMSGLRSPRVVSCIGGRGARDGSFQLFLEFAPGGSLADRVAIDGGLDERAVRGYAADVAAGLAYLHGAGMVHGDVKARNIVIGADGRAKLADFGCARDAGADVPIIGGTPAFMAPEVARGEEQGPAADVWALGCMVVEMATGRAPWSGMDGNALAALHRIGYTEAAPEVPEWMSAEAKDFLRGCLVRQASERCTAAQLLDHPFLASAGIVDAKPQAVESKSKWVSPKSTLDAALWESESDTEEAAEHESTAERRMRALACPASALPDWDSDEGWIDVLSGPSEAVPVAAEETAELDDAITPCGEESGVLDAILVQYSSFVNAGEGYDESVQQSCSARHQSLEDSVSHGLSCILLLNCCFATKILMQLISFLHMLALLLLFTDHTPLLDHRWRVAAPIYSPV